MVWESMWGRQSLGSGAVNDLCVSMSTQVPEDEEEERFLFL